MTKRRKQLILDITKWLESTGTFEGDIYEFETQKLLARAKNELLGGTRVIIKRHLIPTD